MKKNFKLTQKKVAELQVEIMKRKSGQERLEIAMELRRLVLELAKACIKSQNPKITPQKAKALLQRRIYGFSFPFKISRE